MICRYWWSNQKVEKKMHWVGWETLTKPKGEGGLGFRDIHIFNLAMLSKQGWRLIHNPDSLCARVLRAKYFPDGDAMNAKNVRVCSYKWRSILKEIQVLKYGVVWHAGNGRSINIWRDPWLPREWSRKPITPRGNNLLSKVEDLIDPQSGQWDEQLVSQTFWPEDVNTILAIPTHSDLEDLLAWHFDKRGIFTVKSAYKVQRAAEQRRSTRGCQSSSGGSVMKEEHWKGLWKIKCSGKIKHFLWRMAHNSLALRMGLQRRGMEVDTRYVVCQRMNEDGGTCFSSAKQ